MSKNARKYSRGDIITLVAGLHQQTGSAPLGTVFVLLLDIIVSAQGRLSREELAQLCGIAGSVGQAANIEMTVQAIEAVANDPS